VLKNATLMQNANAECKMQTVMQPVSAFGILHFAFCILQRRE
jgi:hypothetical protein